MPKTSTWTLHMVSAIASRTMKTTASGPISLNGVRRLNMYMTNASRQANMANAGFRTSANTPAWSSDRLEKTT